MDKYTFGKTKTSKKDEKKAKPLARKLTIFR
jgi:hypothetical protein